MTAISILIVEDEVLTAMFMEKLLKRKGYNVLKRLSTGEEAVEFAVINKPDLVLMDIRLAGKIDGIEAISRIVAGTSATIRFIFSSGYSDPDLIGRAMKLKPLGFLPKPVDIDDLYSIISSSF